MSCPICELVRSAGADADAAVSAAFVLGMAAGERKQGVGACAGHEVTIKVSLVAIEASMARAAKR
jgi:hypothetical protein